MARRRALSGMRVTDRAATIFGIFGIFGFLYCYYCYLSLPPSGPIRVSESDISDRGTYRDNSDTVGNSDMPDNLDIGHNSGAPIRLV